MMMGFGPLSPQIGAPPLMASTLTPSLPAAPSLSIGLSVALSAQNIPILHPGPKDWSPRGRSGMILVPG